MRHTQHWSDSSKPADPLGEALHFLRMTGTFYCRSEFTAPWGLAVPAMDNSLMFHVVTTGGCRISVGEDQRVLRTGDLVLVPHGAGHTLAGEPDAPAAKLFDLPRELISDRYEILRHGGGGAPTSMICGAVCFDHPAARQLVDLLPKLIHIEASPEIDWLHSTLRFMAAEARDMRPGGDTIITRLADILVIQAIREWIARDPAAQTGWLGALRDRHVGRAISLIHGDPMRNWTVASLAAETALSRSAFAARFAELVGETPIQYQRRWRMYVALTWLRSDATPLGVLAGRLGYQSEAAFSRAFKRMIGVSPGSVRRAGRPRPGTTRAPARTARA